MATANGGVFSVGDAKFYGSAGAMTLKAPIVAIVPTNDGGGYYLIGADGGVLTFGDAKFYGSAGNLALASPIVGASVTADGGGYYLVGADGGVFTFGDAVFAGTLSSTFSGPSPDGPAVGIAANPAGAGYLIATSEGAIVAYGGAPFYGSPALSGVTPAEPVVSVTYAPDGSGYWAAAADGGVFAFNSSMTSGTGSSSTTRQHRARRILRLGSRRDRGIGYHQPEHCGGYRADLLSRPSPPAPRGQQVHAVEEPLPREGLFSFRFPLLGWWPGGRRSRCRSPSSEHGSSPLVPDLAKPELDHRRGTVAG